MTEKVLHYRLPYGWAACNWAIDKPEDMTSRPLKVSCSKCKATKAYREMMEV